MTHAEQIKRHIASHWEGFAAASICNRVIDYIVSQPASKSEMLTYSVIADIGGLSKVDTDVLTAVSIMSGQLQVLLMHFVLVDPDGEQYFLSDDEARDFITESLVVHPITGTLISREEARLLPYYEGNRAKLSMPVSE